MNSLHIRDARDSDRDAIRDVTLSAYEEYAALMPQHWENYRRDVLATLADVRPAEQIIAEQDGSIVGTVLFYPTGASLHRPNNTLVSIDWPEMRLLAVAPAARGQGVGTALMQECVRRARRSRAAAFTLHTTDMMQIAMRMYERMGFVLAPALDFRPAEDVIVKGYRLNLNGATA
jgi:predicted N-acetyltransferase YhbS